jgi:hypothetical protein
MGLIITSEINTDSGITSEAYINISKFEVFKEGGAKASFKLYLNKTIRDTDPSDTVSSKAIFTKFKVMNEDLDISAIYPSIYARLKTLLESDGLTVTDDI